MAERRKRIEQSITLICDALWDLMERKSYSEITISELCEAATVSRNTFYRRFRSLEDVLGYDLEKKAVYIMTQFTKLEHYDLRRPTREDVERTNKRFYQFWFEQRHKLMILNDQGLLHLLDRAFMRAVPITGPKAYEIFVDPSDPDEQRKFKKNYRMN